MMKKIITGLTIAAASLMVSVGTPSFNFVAGETAVTVEAAGKVLSMEEAADKVIKTAHKAYDQKKKLSTTVTIKCSSGSENAIEKCKNKLFKVIAEKELGEFIDDVTIYGLLESRTGMFWSEDNGKMDFDYKNGKLTIKFTNKGNNKKWRWYNEELVYEKQNMGELREVTKGMSEIDRAWRIAVWLMFDHKTKYYGEPSKFATDAKDIAKNRAQGNCSSLNMMYLIYAHRMGIKAGGVSSNNHEITWVYIDGKLYYTDLQGVASDHEGWVYSQTLDYNDENVDASRVVKFVPDPTGRWLKVPKGDAEAMESGFITAYDWEVSEGEACWLTEKQAKIRLPEEGFGKPSKWKYSENIKDYIPDFPTKKIKNWEW